MKMYQKTFFKAPEGCFFRVLFFLRVSLQTEGPGPQGGPARPGPIWPRPYMAPAIYGPGPIWPPALYLGVGPDWLWLWL